MDDKSAATRLLEETMLKEDWVSGTVQRMNKVRKLRESLGSWVRSRKVMEG